jgi:hypothetical protein
MRRQKLKFELETNILDIKEQNCGRLTLQQEQIKWYD